MNAKKINYGVKNSLSIKKPKITPRVSALLIPEDCLQIIFTFLYIDEIFNIKFVCKYFFEIISNPIFWKIMLNVKHIQKLANIILERKNSLSCTQLKHKTDVINSMDLYYKNSKEFIRDLTRGCSLECRYGVYFCLKKETVDDVPKFVTLGTIAWEKMLKISKKKNSTYHLGKNLDSKKVLFYNSNFLEQKIFNFVYFFNQIDRLSKWGKKNIINDFETLNYCIYISCMRFSKSDKNNRFKLKKLAFAIFWDKKYHN